MCSSTGSRSLRASSGSRSASSSIEPFRSAKSTVTCFRSPSRAPLDVRIFSARCLGIYDSGEANRPPGSVTAIGAPQEPQNLLPGGTSVPQATHVGVNGAPQSSQNRMPSRICDWHRGHVMPEASSHLGQESSDRWDEPSADSPGGQAGRSEAKPRGRSADEPVEPARVLAHDLPPDVGRQVPELTLDDLAGVGPDAVGVGEVRAPHDVVDPDLVEQLDADAIRLVGRLALAAPVLARPQAQSEVPELVLPFRIHALEDVRDPADPALADDDPQLRVMLEHAADDQRHEHRRYVELQPCD